MSRFKIFLSSLWLSRYSLLLTLLSAGIGWFSSSVRLSAICLLFATIFACYFLICYLRFMFATGWKFQYSRSYAQVFVRGKLRTLYKVGAKRA